MKIVKIGPSIFKNSKIYRKRRYSNDYKKSPFGCLCQIFVVITILFLFLSPTVVLCNKSKKLVQNNQTLKKITSTEKTDEVKDSISEFFNLAKGAGKEIIVSSKELAKIELDDEAQLKNMLLEKDKTVEKYITEKYKIDPKVQIEDTDIMVIETLKEGSYLETKYGIETYFLWEVWEVSTEYLRKCSNEEELVYVINIENTHRLIADINDTIVDQELKDNDYKKLLVNNQKRNELNNLPGNYLTPKTRKKKYGY